MISDPIKPKDKQFRYRNAAHGVYRMVKDESQQPVPRRCPQHCEWAWRLGCVQC
jgi:hypothetical protein